MTVCFLHPAGYWDKCTTYTSIEAITSEKHCKKKVDEFIQLVGEHVFVPYRVQGKCIKQNGEET